MSSKSSDVLVVIDDQIQDIPIDEAQEINLDGINLGNFSNEVRLKLESLPNLASLSLNDC
jgi:hypothetical protein